MSYTIEVYRGNQKAERHLGIYALYVMFYPQLVAGPIERPQNILHQFYEEHHIDWSRISIGLRIMLWGFFKKVVIADNIANVVNFIYNNPEQQNSFTYILAAILFSFQIYCDFSGYSDIAIGSAKVMGFSLMKNFNVPYISKSIQEFWSRWHISLSTWFRDYVYIPLGGNKVTKPKWVLNIAIVFLLSGFWHGANWTFIVWGAIHAFFNIISIFFSKKENNNSLIRCILNILITFIIVTIAWIFFRINSISGAISIIKTIFLNFTTTLSLFISKQPVFLGLGPYTLLEILKLFALIVILYASDILKEKNNFISFFKKHFWFRLTIYFFLFYSIVFLGFYGETQFIYFQF